LLPGINIGFLEPYRIGLNTDPDPAFEVNTNPDPDPAFEVNTDPVPDPGSFMTNIFLTRIFLFFSQFSSQIAV